MDSKKLVVTVKQGKKLESDECNTSKNCNPKDKISLIGIRRQKNGRYAAVITDRIRHKKVWLGTFDTVEEASQAYFSKKSEFENEKLSNQGKKKSKRIRETRSIVEVYKRGKYNSEKSEELLNVKQGNENVNCEVFQIESAGQSEIDVVISNSFNRGTEQGIDSHEIGTVEEAFRIAKEGSRVFNLGLMANVCGTKSSDDCNNTTSCNPKVKVSLIGTRRQKNGRYAAVITDPFTHKRVQLGTFDTVEEASQAYFSKKSEFEKLSQQGNKQNILKKKNCDQIQQLESLSVVASSDTAASESGIAKRINSQGEEPISSKATSCVKANVYSVESSDECCITTSCDPKARISLTGIRRRKSGRYAAVITDPIKHKEVCLGTFDSMEEASHAYLSKKSEFEKLKQRGDKENKLKKNCDQIQQHESESVVASLDTTARESGSAKRIDSHKTTTHLIGAYRSKTTGRYRSEITNPITKKKIWLGTFGSAEEASHAYQSKKLEFQKLVEAKQQQCTNKQRKSEKLVSVRQGHENVNCEPFHPKSASGSPDIDVPFSNSSNEGTVRSMGSNQSNKFDLQSSKEVELQSNMPTDSSAGEKQVGQEDDEDLWMGKWMQLPGDNRAVMFSLKLGLPIIDNYGYLLGEFSTLDDLSICVTEDDNHR
ncbi:hypothetical protein R3W88_021797 [Solanum pinnatisectum]|uniref:AP2/ERF domain-containing protein n=1 Tax=Solanum pinnatisectum TaxID=50273 RepID=A0AAV9LW87_9SOLN|nr:hypothetical protein R3W88_021797 [Solanum pinnatisectum]